MDKRIAIALIALLPCIASANGPMGPGSDFGMDSNVYYRCGVGRFWGTNKSTGTLLFWVRDYSDEFIGPVFDCVLSTTDRLGNHKTPTLSPRLDGSLQVYGRPASGGNTYARRYYFDSYWGDGSGPGISNQWSLMVFGSDGVTNYAWLNGLEPVSNVLTASSFATEVWFDTWDGQYLAIGASDKNGAVSPSGRNHFEGVADTIVYYPDDLLTIDEIARIWNTRGRWYPRHNRFMYRGMKGYATGASLSSNDLGIVEDGGKGVNARAQGPVLASDMFTRRRRRQ